MPYGPGPGSRGGIAYAESVEHLQMASAPGPQGPAGNTGATGTQGPQSPAGNTGATGPAGADGIEDAPNDGQIYGRQAGAWVIIPTP
jgi:hypothetical protein